MNIIIRGAIFVGVFGLLLLIERVRPLRIRTKGLAGRWSVNLAVTGLAFLTGFLLVRKTAFILTDWTAENSFGVLYWLPSGTSVRMAAGFLLMDLTFYYWHRVNHTFKLLWRFHNVHHLDPDMDVTTSFRFHFMEIIFSIGFRCLQVGLLGIDVSTYIVYELVFQTATMFHHSNVRLPIKVERWLNKIIVTPRMHGIHHSAIQEETNSNYGTIFRFWDWLHGTIILKVLQSQITIGVAGYRQPGDNKFLNLVVLPFCRQRDYWAGAEKRTDFLERLGKTETPIIAEKNYLLE